MQEVCQKLAEFFQRKGAKFTKCTIILHDDLHDDLEVSGNCFDILQIAMFSRFDDDFVEILDEAQRAGVREIFITSDTVTCARR